MWLDDRPLVALYVHMGLEHEVYSDDEPWRHDGVYACIWMVSTISTVAYCHGMDTQHIAAVGKGNIVCILDCIISL